MAARSRAEEFFTAGEKVKLKAAVQEIESATSGEIVVMVVDRSDPYREAEILGGALFGSLLSLILALLFFQASVWSYVPLSFLFFFPCWWFFRKLETLKRPFVGLRRREEAVRMRAEREFLEKGFYRTKRDTGVLFFLSLFERKIWIFAGQAVHEKMNQETLNRLAGEVSRGIRDGRACEALLEAIRETGELLSRYFPVTSDDADELPDEVVTGE